MKGWIFQRTAPADAFQFKASVMVFFNLRDIGIDSGSLSFGQQYLHESAVDRRLHFLRGLSRLDLHDALALLDLISDVFQPARDGALLDSHSRLHQIDLGRHITFSIAATILSDVGKSCASSA